MTASWIRMPILALAATGAIADLAERPIDRVMEAAVEAFAAALESEASVQAGHAPSAVVELRAQAVAEALASSSGGG